MALVQQENEVYSSYKISKALSTIAKQIEMFFYSIVEVKVGFSLIVFPLDEEGSTVEYISNCQRKDVITAYKTLLEHWDNAGLDVPSHKKN